MFYRIKHVTAVDDCKLMVYFEDNQHRCYDVKQMAYRFPAFQRLLSDTELFGRVKVDPGGYGISWNDELDIGCNEIWENGRKI